MKVKRLTHELLPSEVTASTSGDNANNNIGARLRKETMNVEREHVSDNYHECG